MKNLDQALEGLRLAMIAKKGNNHSIDPDIKDWFGENKITHQQNIETDIYRFQETILEGNIQTQQGDRYEAGLIECLLKATILIKLTKISPGTGVLIRISNSHRGEKCGLVVSHRCNGRLEICVDAVNPERIWSYGDGVLRKKVKK
jgi:hypothetical protein